MKKFLLLVLFLSCQLVALQAQELKKSALNNFNNQNWEAAAKDYLKYLKKNDGDSSDFYNLAVSKARLEEYDKAIEYFREAKKRNFNRQFIYYGISKSYAKMDDEGGLMTALKEGAENGLATYTLLASDSAFADYRGSEGFKKVLEKIKLNAYPCMSSKNYRHFDFWVGEWDVLVNGNKVGENFITMAKGGCAIHETYTTGGNYAGQSINFYDPIDKKWHQHWVGSSGDVYNYLETKHAEGFLQFESKFANPQGNISLSRLSFTLNEDGTVTQLFESSNDEGQTWISAFNGLYRKRKADDKDE